MKQHLLFIFTFFLQISSQAQTDSLSMLPGNVVDCYYNLSSGNADTVRNTNWHLAFAIRKAQPPLKTMQSATIRINEGRNVELYRSSQLITNWSTFDTSGWMNWAQQYNSDSTWDIGAFNQDRNLSNAFDYGWGQYNMATKDVTGTGIFLLAFASSPLPGSPKTFKKLFIDRIVYDTMWVFTCSNLDGSDSITYQIRKTAFSNKLFAYVNLLTGQVIDREPPLNSWNLLFTRYKCQVTVSGQTLMYPVMGVLLNPTATAAVWENPNARIDQPDSSLHFVANINRVGWDWKLLTMAPGTWPVRDSLAYVVKLGANNYYKIAFTDYFSDPSLQFIKFNKNFYSLLNTTTELVGITGGLQVYPNPATNRIQIETNILKLTDIQLSLFDLNGNKVIEKLDIAPSGVYLQTLETAGLKSGIYLLQVAGEGWLKHQKVLVN